MWEWIKSRLRREYGKERDKEMSTNKEDSKKRAYGEYLRRQRGSGDEDGMRRTRGEEKESPMMLPLRQPSDLSALPVWLALCYTAHRTSHSSTFPSAHTVTNSFSASPISNTVTPRRGRLARSHAAPACTKSENQSTVNTLTIRYR